MKFKMGYVGATHMQFNVRLEQAACGGRGALDLGGMGVGSNSVERSL